MNLRKLFIVISNKHDLYYRIVLISLSVLTVTYFLPSKRHFKFDFEKGNTWNYEDLYAPFEFPVYKPQSRMEEEKGLVNQQSPLFFRLDTFAERRAVLEFESLYGEENAVGLTAGRNILHQLYRKGVLEIPKGNFSIQSQPMVLLQGNVSQTTYPDVHLLPSQLAAQAERELIARHLQSDGQLLSAILQSVKPNIVFDAGLTESNRKQLLESINPVRGLITKGTLLAQRNKPITEEEYINLSSLRKAYELEDGEARFPYTLYLGYLLLVCSATSVLLTFLWLLRKDILLDSRKISLLFLLIVATCLMFTFFLAKNKVNLLVLPLCILPLVTRAFFDTRTALFTHVLTMLILGTIAPDGFDFVFMQIIAGMVAIFSIVNMRKRSQLFLAAGTIFLAYAVTYIGLCLLSEDSIQEINYINAIWLLANCFLTLLSYPLIFFLEKTFRVTSDFTLMELTDYNSELLRELALKAPGTFQHSMQVANLAEAAIYKIGGNSLLVRVGALYHDIGKMDIPMYFIENQSTLVNPHDDLSFDESAAIIISHVIRGVERARKHNLPDVIIDFIRTHHGTMMVQYFYQRFLKSFPGEIANEDDFRYPGPKPYSKETAVLMMADSVEAAARSLTVHDAESIDKLVEKIISHQIDSGQFENCDITYRDITSIKRIFKRMLTSIYHVRIAYPGS